MDGVPGDYPIAFLQGLYLDGFSSFTPRQREAQADLKRQQATQEQAKATQREKLTTLTASVAGVVQQLATNTAGGLVRRPKR